jgi:outer membrane lipoprotein LolB
VNRCARPRRAAIAVFGLVLLAACAPRSLVVPATDWPARRAALQSLPAWSLSGRVAVAAAGEGFSAHLDWAQHESRSSIDLVGPFGAGALHVELTDDEILLRDGDGTEVATGPAALAERLGFELPLRELRYWALGVRAPVAAGMPDGVEVLGPQGRPTTFQDGDWRVRIEGWRTVADDLLPARLLITRPGARLKLVVDAWRLGAGAP